jgi:hypothetical protein
MGDRGMAMGVMIELWMMVMDDGRWRECGKSTRIDAKFQKEEWHQNLSISRWRVVLA